MGGTGPLYVLCGADPWGRSWGRPCRSFCAARFGASSSRWRAPTRADLRRARRLRLAPQPASNRARARLRRDVQIQILALIATRSRSADAGCGAETEFDSRPRLVKRAGRGASARWASSLLSVSSLSLDSPFVCVRVSPFCSLFVNLRAFRHGARRDTGRRSRASARRLRARARVVVVVVVVVIRCRSPSSPAARPSRT